MPPGKILDRVRSNECLETTFEGAWAAIAGRRVSAGHWQPADLSGAAARTPVQAATEDGRESHAAPHPEQDEVVVVSSSAVVLLGNTRKIHIVLQRDPATQVTAQGIEQPAMPAWQIPGEADIAAVRIDQAGGTDHNLADLSQPDTGMLSRAFDRPMDDSHRIGGALRGKVAVSGHLTGDVGYCGFDPIGSHIDA